MGELSDWDLFLKEYDATEEMVEEYNKRMDVNHLVDLPTDLYYKDKSPIHGYGIFASRKINENDSIGVVAYTTHVRSFLGRYGNHDKNNNAKCVFVRHPTILATMFAVKDIKKNEEIVCNYRHHISKQAYPHNVR